MHIVGKHYESCKEVRERCLKEQFPKKSVDLSQQFIKKSNREQLRLGKLRHVGAEINFLILN